MLVHESLSEQQGVSECFQQTQDLINLYFKKLMLAGTRRITGDKTTGRVYQLGGCGSKPHERQ